MSPHKATTLPGSARPRSVSANFMKAVHHNENVTFTVIVRRRPEGPVLPDLEYWQNTPIHKRRFPSVDEYAKMYGSSAEDMETVSTTLQKHGMALINQHAGARTVTVQASAGQIASSFGVHLNYYHAPTPIAMLRKSRGSPKSSPDPLTETHIGYDGEVSVPHALVGIVLHIVGLDNRSIAAPTGFSGDPVNSFLVNVPTIAGLYNFPPNLSAADQTIGIFNGGSGPYLASDVTLYVAGLPAGFNVAPTLVDVPLTVGSSSYANSPSTVQGITSVNQASNATLEVTQDIMTLTTIAQGCTANVYFSDITEQGWIVFLNRVLFPQSEKQPSVVSISYIMFNETTYGTVFSDLFQQLAAVGINVFACAGDWGADDLVVDGSEHVGYPASDPWVTCVGGTVVGNVTNGPPVTFDEYVWSDEGNSASNFQFPGGGTTGGGMSTLFATPAYQTAAGITQSTDSSSTIRNGGRFVPDIAGMVGYSPFFVNGFSYGFIGTSCSTPLYAGLCAALRSSFGQSFGFLNPTLYQLGNLAIKDITNVGDALGGNNDSGDTPDSPYFLTGPGYDPTTGWGSIDGAKMFTALSNILYQPSMSITMVKNSFGLGEVQAKGLNFLWSSAFYVTLDGFSPNQVGSFLPNIVGVDNKSSLGLDSIIKPQVPILELPSQPATVQRILFPFQVSFGPVSQHAVNDQNTPGIFPAAGSPQIDILIVADLALTNVPQQPPFSAFGTITLLAGADPFFSNVTLDQNLDNENAWYLSNDLRVFTVCPGINATPINSSSNPGAPTLSPASGDLTDFDSNAGYQYIMNLLGYFNGNFQAQTSFDPFTLLPDQSSALTEDSLVAPTQVNPAVSGQQFANYTFAIARVRSNTDTSGLPVKVFFRLFTSNHPQIWYLPTTTYNSSPGFPALPEAPLVATDMTSIPFFASGNYNANTDYSAGGANNTVITNTGSSWTYFGCYLNVYAGDDQITYSGVTKPVSGWLMGGHQCLVAEIAFDDAPISNSDGIFASPMNSDKLAQRNLQVTLADNPGSPDTKLVPQTFDVAPSVPPPANPGQLMDLPDELMIDWGNAPVGSTCTVYWPAVEATDVIGLAKRLYPTHQLSPVGGDPFTFTIPVTNGFTFVPIPFGTGPNFAGLVTLQLPFGIVRGQIYFITLRRIATRAYQPREAPPPPRVPQIERPTAATQWSSDSFVKVNSKKAFAPLRVSRVKNWRYTAGMFAIRIPVTNAAPMLAIERNIQAIIAWRLNGMATSDRWYNVMQRYLSYLDRIVDGLGGGDLPVVPSPIGVVTIPKPCFPSHDCHHHRLCEHNQECCKCHHRHENSLCSQNYTGLRHCFGHPEHHHQYPMREDGPECCKHRSGSEKGHPDCKNCNKVKSHHCLHHKHSSCASNAGNCHFRGKVVGLCYDHFGDFESFIVDNQCDGLQRRIRCGERSVVDVIDKAWERRDCVEVFTKEDDHEQLESIILGGPV